LLEAIGSDDTAPRADWLHEAGAESSAAERNALELERLGDDVCSAFLLERVLSEGGRMRSFEGEVVGLVGPGAFVCFGDELFEGFLPARSVHNEWWNLNETNTALVSERSARVIRLGDTVRVTVDRVDAPRGRVDLVCDRRQDG
jgi:ribonuclease R